MGGGGAGGEANAVNPPSSGCFCPPVTAVIDIWEKCSSTPTLGLSSTRTLIGGKFPRGMVDKVESKEDVIPNIGESGTD